MQATVVPPPQAPASVLIDAGPTTAAQTIAIPRSVEEIEGLRQQRSELADQLERAGNRRAEVIGQIREASGAERGGLEQRLAGLDNRILQIEADIAATERALTNTPASVLGAAAQAQQARDDAREAARSPLDDGVLAAIAGFATVLALPLVIAHTRRIWRRQPAAAALPAATEGRLERIEQAVDAIAVEVERVSEGQRFVTRLMSEGKTSSLPSPDRLS